MKKLLLLVAAATLTLGATAATPKLALQAKRATTSAQTFELRQYVVEKNLNAADQWTREANVQTSALRAKAAKAFVNPEGTPMPYVFSDKYYSDVIVSVSTSEDGSKVFFSNMFPAKFSDGEAWVQGDVSSDGTSVTIPLTPITEITASNGNTYPVCPAEMVVEGGYITGMKELVFAKDGGKIYVDDNAENPVRYIGLCAIGTDGAFAGYFDNTRLIAYEPFEGNTDAVELPEGAQPADFIYYWMDGEGNKYEKGQVYVDGNDVYMNMLTPGVEAWVKGTKDGNAVTFKAGQFVPGTEYYLYFQPVFTDGTTDEEGYLIPTFADEIVLTYDPETGAYSNLDKNYFITVATLSGLFYDFGTQFVVEPYAGDAPAVPADAYNLEISGEYLDYYGLYLFFYNIDNLDVNGKYLNPENLGYYIYQDGEIYTFTPDMYIKLTEEMTLVPYGYVDNYDFGDGYLFFGETLFSKLGVQTVYTVDGVTNYSNVVSVDMEGNVTVEPAPQEVVGLDNMNVKKVTSVEFYDAEGRKLDAAQKGVNVVKMVAADGSVKTVKMFKK